jgi:hypothetical protein
MHGKCMNYSSIFILSGVFLNQAWLCADGMGIALLCAEYRNAAEEVCMPPAFVGD